MVRIVKQIVYMFSREVIRGFAWETVKLGMRTIKSIAEKVISWFKGVVGDDTKYSTSGNIRISAGKVL